MTRPLKIAALVIAGAVLSLMLAVNVLAQDVPEDMPLPDNGGFVAWLTAPQSASMLVFIVTFLAGAIVGGSFMFLKYHVFKISFERLGRVFLFLMPLAAVCAVAGTLALHKYNLFLLSIYLVIPLIGAPIIYLLYDRLLVEESDRLKL